MQKLLKTVLLAVACGSPYVCAQAPAAKVIAPPSAFVLPSYTKTVLPNGLVVLMFEKHDVPIISMNLTLRSGAVADPAGKEGVAVLTAGLLRRGTKNRTAEQIANELDFMGMTFGGWGSNGVTLDATSVSAEFLKKDEATALPLVADILLHPSFPADEVSKALARAQDSARSAKDNPQQVIRSYFVKFLYGSHPYGRPTAGDEDSVKRITRDDILAFYKTNYTPGNAILAVVGDFDANAMKAELEKSFGGWSGKAPALLALAPIKPVVGRRLLFVDKPDATQTYFYMGNVGVDATNPDRGEIGVVNELYGGRFTSLFNTELRIKSGYSYGASSSYSDGTLHMRRASARLNSPRPKTPSQARCLRVSRPRRSLRMWWPAMSCTESPASSSTPTWYWRRRRRLPMRSASSTRTSRQPTIWSSWWWAKGRRSSH
jgi:zinc protease